MDQPTPSTGCPLTRIEQTTLPDSDKQWMTPLEFDQQSDRAAPKLECTEALEKSTPPVADLGKK